MTNSCMFTIRYDKRRSPSPGGAWLPDAVSARLPAGSLRHNARVLGEGGDGTADVRDAPLEARGVFCATGQRVHRRYDGRALGFRILCV